MEKLDGTVMLVADNGCGGHEIVSGLMKV